SSGANNRSGSSYDRQHHRQSPPISRWRKRGADAEAIGRSRGGTDTAYDSDTLRDFLTARGTQPVIPNNPTRKRMQPFDPIAYKRRNIIERTFCRLKDWRRIATRYDKL
ncbi:hypothetical protein ELI13_38430, partial [Rhizobium ruizarguesonis]